MLSKESVASPSVTFHRSLDSTSLDDTESLGATVIANLMRHTVAKESSAGWVVVGVGVGPKEDAEM